MHAPLSSGERYPASSSIPNAARCQPAIARSLRMSSTRSLRCLQPEVLLLGWPCGRPSLPRRIVQGAARYSHAGHGCRSVPAIQPSVPSWLGAVLCFRNVSADWSATVRCSRHRSRRRHLQAQSLRGTQHQPAAECAVAAAQAVELSRSDCAAMCGMCAGVLSRIGASPFKSVLPWLIMACGPGLIAGQPRPCATDPCLAATGSGVFQRTCSRGSAPYDPLDTRRV